MLRINLLEDTHYDAKLKIWSGGKGKTSYDLNQSMGQILFEKLNRQSQRVLQISDSEGTRLTNEDILRQAIRIARNLQATGIKQSDIIGIAARNTTYLTSLALACFFNGTPFQAINPVHDAKTAQTLFNLTQPRVVFCDGDNYEKIKAAVSSYNPKIFTLNQYIDGVPSVLDLLHATEDESSYRPSELEHGPDQTLAILCSSGTTGTPKAVTISNNTRMFESAEYLTPEDVLFATSTLDWLSGLYIMLDSLIYGSLRVITEDAFTPENYLRIIQKYRVTFTILAPSQMAMLVNYPQISAQQLNSLRYLLFGGDKSTTRTQELMQSHLKNCKICYGYGFTELAAIISRNFQCDSKPNSVGRLLPGFKIKIVNEAGNNLGPNEVGEIYCYHGRKWNGYYGNKSATNEMWDTEQWFHSGDLGYFDDDQFLYIVDRKKNLVKFRSLIYCPYEIEEVISELPDVIEVCVVGIWNEFDGDAPAAAIVTAEGSSLTAEEAIDYVRKNVEVEYKRLHGGAVILPELPKNPNGKVDRAAIKRAILDATNNNIL